MRTRLPLVVLVLGLLVQGGGIYLRAQRSVQPPLADTVSYLQKARNFWDTLGAGRWPAPLATPPAMRPPGTILLSAPLGFEADHRGFLFRSVWIPSVLVALATWLACGSHAGAPGGWRVAALAAGLASLPCFFHFEPWDGPTPASWGLVDGFLSATTALAATVSLRGARSTSWPWTVSGVLLGVFGVFVKPIGLVLLVPLALAWGFSARGGRRVVASGLLLHAAAGALAAGIALSSPYLGPENLEYGRRSSEQLRRVWLAGEHWATLRDEFHLSYGFHWLLYLAGGLAAAAAARVGPPARDLLGALAFLVFGGVSWGFTGASMRYLFPFVVAPMVLVAPRALEGWTALSGGSRLVAGLPAVPFAALVLVLFSVEPVPQLQSWLGVNLRTGQCAEETALARALLRKALERGRDVEIYSFYTRDYRELLPLSAGQHATVVAPRAPRLTGHIAIDWGGVSTFRLALLSSSDYLVFQPPEAATAAASLARAAVPDVIAEADVFRAWARTAEASDGVVPELAGGTLVALRVDDRERLAASLRRLYAHRQWSADFEAANAAWLTAR